MDDVFYQEMLNWFAALDHQSLADFHHFTRDAGLTMLQMHVLMYLHSHGSCDMTDLVKATLTSKAAVSQMVDRLVQQQLIERAEAPTDRRVKLVTLTRKGKRIVDASMHARQGWLERASSALTAQQKQQVANALHVLADASARSESDVHTQSEYSAYKPRARAQVERKTKSEG